MAKRKPKTAPVLTPPTPPADIICQLCDKPITPKMDLSSRVVTWERRATCCGGYVHIECDKEIVRSKIPAIRYPTDAAHDRYERDLASGKRRDPFTEVRVSLPGLCDMTGFRPHKVVRAMARENFQTILDSKTPKERKDMLTVEEHRAIEWSSNPTKVMAKLMQRLRRTS